MHELKYKWKQMWRLGEKWISSETQYSSIHWKCRRCKVFHFFTCLFLQILSILGLCQEPWTYTTMTFIFTLYYIVKRCHFHPFIWTMWKSYISHFLGFIAPSVCTSHSWVLEGQLPTHGGRKFSALWVYTRKSKDHVYSARDSDSDLNDAKPWMWIWFWSWHFAKGLVVLKFMKQMLSRFTGCQGCVKCDCIS